MPVTLLVCGKQEMHTKFCRKLSCNAVGVRRSWVWGRGVIIRSQYREINCKQFAVFLTQDLLNGGELIVIVLLSR